MSKLRRAALCLFGVLCLSFAVVNTASATPAYVGPFHISILLDGEESNNTGLFIYPDVYQNTSVQCGYMDFYVLDGLGANYKTQSAMIMAAYLAGKPVTLHLDTTQCFWGRPKILSVTITN